MIVISTYKGLEKHFPTLLYCSLGKKGLAINLQVHYSVQQTPKNILSQHIVLKKICQRDTQSKGIANTLIK